MPSLPPAGLSDGSVWQRMLSVCTLALGLFSLFPAASQAHEQSLTPQAIHFDGAEGYTDEELAGAAGLAIGQTYSADGLKQRAQQLLDIGIFEKISYKFDGSQLSYAVKMNSQVYPIQLSNLPIESGEKLENQLHAKIPLYHGAVPAQGLLLEAVRRTLEDMLTGVDIHAQVGTELVEDPATHAPVAVRFSIVSQPVKIGNLKLEGVSDYLRPLLDKNLKISEMSFDPEHSTADIEHQIAEIYAGHGFAAAEVHAVRYGYPVIEEGVIRVPYKVTVKEGRSYRLGTVTFAHDLPIDPAEIDRLMGTRTSFMPENMFLESLVSQLEVRLKGQGYPNSHVTLEPRLDNAKGVANYVVNADLGQTERTSVVKTDSANNGLQNLIKH